MNKGRSIKSRFFIGGPLALALLVGFMQCAFANGAPYSRAIERLKSSDSSERLAAASELLKGAPNSLDSLVSTIKEIYPVYSANPGDRQTKLFLIEVMSVVSQILERGTAFVMYFRGADDCLVVTDLIQLALSEDRSVRLPATKILVDIVDNTTVSLVTETISARRSINDDSMFNLLQVLRLVSSYAYKDNKDRIAAAVTTVRAVADGDRIRFAKTAALLDSIDAAIQGNPLTATTKEGLGAEVCQLPSNSR